MKHISSISRAPTVYDTERLARRFLRFLYLAIGDKDFDEFKAKTRAEAEDGGTCFSHDYCDANVVMMSAWKDTQPAPMRMDSDEHAGLWNEAWDRAKQIVRTE